MSASPWTHAICPTCWEDRNPGRVAIRVINDTASPCCYCAEDTALGVYVRDDPETTPCHGKTGIHA